MKGLGKYIFPTIVALSALSISASAAFYSVFGLSKLFAGASIAVIIMAGALEISKLVIASFLYRFWNKLNVFLRSYLSIATLVLILITSLGIYGFLSSAYQQTAAQFSVIENEVSFLKQKESFLLNDIKRYDDELERISNTISNLSQARATQIQVRDTSSSTGFRTTVSTSELRLAESRIQAEESNRREIISKREQSTNELQSLQNQILTLESSSDLAAELGPLKYIAGVFNTSMDKVVNILILIIIFVFDPLAISLVISANMAFKNLEEDVEPVIQVDTTDNNLDNYVEQEVKDPYIDEMEEVFDETYTGKDPNPKVVKILQRTPSHRYVVLDNGQKLKVKKDQISDDLTLRYL